MATTTNFGWPTPDDTDLVKNGAAAMRSLGSGIDTSLVKLKGGTTGQILSKASNTDLDYVWIANDQGDITAVTAGTGITGGGTSGAVTITNEMATTIDAKGDLIVGTADNTFARLGVGSNDQVLTADSTTATGLKWATSSVATSLGFTAGKNAILNGDFRINQRAFSTTTSNNVYTFDRWVTNINGTGTISAQTFTAGTAPVTGYEGINFIRIAASSQGAGNYVSINQRIEDVRVFANQTFTISFWAKASSGTPKVSAYIGQTFGSGGSAAVYTYGSAPTISTSWARYSITITAPSISGKTIGTGSYLDLGVEASDSFNTNLGAQNATIDVWGVQAEAGSVATAFQTATGTIQGELAACQRYYFRIGGEKVYEQMGIGMAGSATAAGISVYLPVSMRVAPISIDFSTLALQPYINGTITAVTSATIDSVISRNVGSITANVASGLTTGQTYRMFSNNSTSGYIGFSAEL